MYVCTDSIYIQILGLFCSEEEVLTKTDSGDICERLPSFPPNILPVKCDSYTMKYAKWLIFGIPALKRQVSLPQ